MEMKGITIDSTDDMKVTAARIDTDRWVVRFEYASRPDISELMFCCTPYDFVYERNKGRKIVSAWEQRYPSDPNRALEQIRHEWLAMQTEMERMNEVRKYNLEHGVREHLGRPSLGRYCDQFMIVSDGKVHGFTDSLMDAHRLIGLLPAGPYVVSSLEVWDGENDAAGYIGRCRGNWNFATSGLPETTLGDDVPADLVPPEEFACHDN